MKYPLSEIFDRLTIETRKANYGANNSILLSGYRQAIEEEFDDFSGVLILAVELAIANTDIANLEWAIRSGKDLPLEEIGRRALAIRRLNDRRVEIKERLAGFFSEYADSRRYDGESFTSILQPHAN